MTNQVPQHGQTVVFTVVPVGSYCAAGEAYRVEHNGKKGHDFRFVSVERGSSTYDSPWAVARSQWAGGVMIRCDVCDAPTANLENEYGEHVCQDCEQNRAEAAWERHCEAFYDGGALGWMSLADQQAAARRLK